MNEKVAWWKKRIAKEVELVIKGSKTQYMIASPNKPPTPIHLVIDHRTFKSNNLPLWEGKVKRGSI